MLVRRQRARCSRPWSSGECLNRPGFYRDSVSCQSGSFLTVFEHSSELRIRLATSLAIEECSRFVVEPIHPLAGLPFYGNLIVEETNRMD